MLVINKLMIRSYLFTAVAGGQGGGGKVLEANFSGLGCVLLRDLLGAIFWRAIELICII